ncbi:MAG: bifunctional phosphoglucose/phosphomannose isomerase, partial [Candidatus Cloacimonadales bacterium]|nr:bifunctional phosphoglucose/phosphomannose isomerase [Candidatus Cloacimonadales bacterium]
SAISGDIAKAAFENLIPIEVVKYYDLPHIDANTLVITISYSGNTEETLSCLQQAMEKTSLIGAITAGGKMLELVEKKYPWVEVQSGFPPRAAIARLFFSLLRLLEEFKVIPSQTQIVKNTVANLIKKADSICQDSPVEENLAKISAEQIKDTIPIIYSSVPQLFPLAYRWKCQINENAKYPAFSNTLPEMNHNEIEGWEVKGFSGTMLPIFLGFMQEKPQLHKRKTVIKKLFTEQNIDYLEFFVEGNSLIEQIFSLIYLGDMISYYLAILQKVNPTSIDFIDHLKQNL